MAGMPMMPREPQPAFRAPMGPPLEVPPSAPPGGPMDQALVNALSQSEPAIEAQPDQADRDPILLVISLLEQGQIPAAINLLLQLRGVMSEGGPEAGPPPGMMG